MTRRGTRTIDFNKRNKLAFTDKEETAIIYALKKLYRRALFHLVAPQFKLPSLPDVYHSLIPQRVQEIMIETQNLMVPSPYTSMFEDAIPCTDRVSLVVRSNRFIVQSSKVELVGLPPAVLGEFGEAAHACCKQWDNIINMFRLALKSANNRNMSRSAIAFHWPCVVALLKMGGCPDDTLTEVSRPGNIPAEFVGQMRDTNVFVMQHMLLPDIDETTGYEGNPVTGVAAQLRFYDPYTSLGNTFWPA